MTVSFVDIERAARQIEGVLTRTPSKCSKPLSELTSADVIVKYENVQITGSFKVRGALVKLTKLRDAGVKGVIAMSAGNHAQGVAYHARRLKLAAKIVMPKWTPFSKVRQTQELGAEVMLHGDSIAESAAHAQAICERESLTFVHPYDDDDIIAGQGTVALELLQDHPNLDVLIVPVGGGGLIAGCAIAAKAMNPSISVIGIEAALFPSLANALRGATPSDGGQSIADGIAVKAVGDKPLAIARDFVDDVEMVSESEIEQSIFDFLELDKTVVEGAGAATLAGLCKRQAEFEGKRVGLIASGGNIDSRVLASVITRGLVRGGRIVNFRIEIFDVPGQLGRMADIIGTAGGNIIEVRHQRLFSDIPVRKLEIDIMVETRGRPHVSEIMERLLETAHRVRILSTTDDG